MNPKELREQRKRLAEQANGILAKAVAENRALSPEELEQVDKIHADVDRLKATIDRVERAIDEERAIVPESQRPAPVAAAEAETALAVVGARAFRTWAAHGAAGLTPEERAALHVRPAGSGSEIVITFPTPAAELRLSRREREARVAQTITTTGGGYMIARQFSNELERAMLWYGGMIGTGRVIDTATGAPLDWPTSDDTTNTGRLLAINTAATQTGFTVGVVVFDAYKYSSDSVLVPVELMQDSAFDIDSLVGAMLGERLGRILNNHLTIGTGVSQPNGVVTASFLGKTGTTGQTTAVIYDDLVDLVYSVDRNYRGNAKFMMADASVAKIRKLKDSQNLPIWQAGSPTAGEPDLLLGYPIIINNDVPVMAANAKSILFGDFSKYIVRRVKDITLLRLNERYAESHQVGFLAFARFDGDLIDAGTHPIRHYANSAT